MQAAKATTSSAARILPTNPTDSSLPPPTGAAPMDEDDDMNEPGASALHALLLPADLHHK